MNLKERGHLIIPVVTIVLSVLGMIVAASERLTKRLEGLDTRLGKLESAIRTMNVTTPDERYRELVKELIAQERSQLTGPQKAEATHRFGKSVFPADAGAAASAPATPK